MASHSRRFPPAQQRRRVDPDLPGLEARLALYRREVFGRHIHDRWCVGVVLAGATRLWRCGRYEVLTAGSVICLAPGEPHACNPVPDGRFVSLMFFLGPEAVLLASGCRRPVFAWSGKNDVFLARRLAGLYRSLGGPASPMEKQCAVIQRLGGLWQPDGQPESWPRDSGLVAAIKDYLHGHYCQGVTLAELAALTGRSPAYVLRRFKREAGLPPHAYQNFVRVEQAKRLLTQGLPAAQVALDVGFADQSHLIRTFLSYVGTTPRQYCLSLQS